MKKSIEQNGLILMLLVILSSLAENLAVQFIFTPSPNIGVYKLAHYQCAVDHTGVGITWLVNGTGSADNKIIKLGIVTNGAGSHNSSLTIPGDSQYNNTIVRCNAFGIVNGNSYFNYNQATLKIQDKLSKIENFTCNANGYYYINCSWSRPFSLDGVPIYGYIINVTNEGDDTQYTTYTNTTSWIYHPNQFDNYTISVAIAGNNSAGKGNMTYQFLILSNITSSNYFVTAEKVNSNWRTTFILKNATFLYKKPLYILAHITPVNNDISPINGQGSGTFEGDTFIGTVNMGELPEKKKWMISFLIYNSGLHYINVSQHTEFSTFNVINGSLKVMKTVGEVCFTCYFVEGSQVQGCFVKYKCLRTDFNGNITINKTSKYDSNTTDCVTEIQSSIYNVTFYDLDHNMTYEDNYAVKLTSQSVDGLSSSHMTSTPSVPLSTNAFSSTNHDISSSIDASSSTDVSASIDVSSSPTMLCTYCTNIGNNQGYLSVVIVGIILFMIVILIVTIAVISVIICHKTKKKKKPTELPIVIESSLVTAIKNVTCSNED